MASGAALASTRRRRHVSGVEYAVRHATASAAYKVENPLHASAIWTMPFGMCSVVPSTKTGMPSQGITAAPGQWVLDAEIFVLSSRFESFGNVVTEAMSAGLAVVSFDCPWGPGDIVRHEVDGVLVPPEDVAALADALRRLTADQDLRRRLGNAARTGVRRFAAEPIMGLWHELIVDATRAGRRRPTGLG